MTDIYITKYALTEGIWKRELVKEEGHMAVAKCPGWLNDVGYFHGKDWHRTEQEAIARADEMRRKKIAAMKKAIAKLEAMTFRTE